MTITAEQAAKLLEGTTPGNIVQIVDDLGWSADFDEGDCAWIQIGPEGGPVTALVVARGNGGRRLDANAALYAAAPDLARALIASEAARKLAEERLAKAVEGLSALNRAAGEVARQGAVTGPQWTRLNVALLKARANLKEIDNG